MIEPVYAYRARCIHCNTSSDLYKNLDQLCADLTKKGWVISNYKTVAICPKCASKVNTNK